MDATTSGTPSIQLHNIPEQQIAGLVIPEQPIVALMTSPLPIFERELKRSCFGNASPGEFPLSETPSIVLHVLTAFNLDPEDLAKLEASSPFFCCISMLTI